MAINFTPDDVASGFNLSKLNSNFDKVETALADALSRSGNGPNQMEADIDLNSNDLLNVSRIDVNEIILDGANLIPSQLADAGFFIRRFATLTDATTFQIPQNVERVYVEDREAFYKRSSTDEGLAGFTANDGDFWKIDEPILRPVMFGIIGDESDETTKLQALLNYAAGGHIDWPVGKTFGYTALEVPNDVVFTGFGFTFKRLVTGSSPGFRINNWLRADYLKFSSPGGTGGDRCVKIQGSNNSIGFFQAEADAQGNESSTNWAIEMESNPAGTTLARNNIDAAFCSNYSTFLFGKNLTFINVNNIVVENYRTAVYLRDTVRSRFVKFRIRGLGAAVNGAPGENGLLLEATIANAMSDITFEDWIVEDSGEHAFRLGGQQTIRNIWFNQCIAKRSGSSILSGNLSSGEWHGGCGFKVLGGGIVGGTSHKNIFLNNCGVLDSNQTFGSYPAGHGTNNFSPYMIVLAENVYLNNCYIDTEALTTSCRNGIMVGHCNGVFINNCNFLKCELTAIKPYQEGTFVGFPAYDTVPLTEFHVRGGKFEVTTASAGNGIVYYMSDNTTLAHRNWSIKGAELRGGAAAIRVETVGAGGSYTNCSADFIYLDPTSVTDAAATSPIILGNGVSNWICNFASYDRPSAFSIPIANGSSHTRINLAKVYDKIGGVWFERLFAQSGYTPVATITTNLDTVTPTFAQYTRIGNIVQVTGQVTFDPTATGTVSARLTLPVASNFTATREASGTFDAGDGTIHGSITADTVNDQFIFSGNSSVTSARACAYTVTYLVV